jgi:hypothetical protein
MNLYQKRASLRIDADLPVTMVDMVDGETPAIVGAARNISLGGIYFESEVELNVGQKVTLQLPTLKGMVELNTVVLRKVGIGYACEFVDLDLSRARVLSDSFFPAFEP